MFLEEMEQVVPWKKLCALIEPHYPKAGHGRFGEISKEGRLVPLDPVASHASAKAAGMSSKATIQWNQTTTMEEKPTGMAIMCKARLTA